AFGKIDELAEKLAAERRRVNELEGQMEEFNGTIEQLEATVAEQKAAIEQLQSQLGGPEGRLTEGAVGEPNSGVVAEPSEQEGGGEFE
ncbi:MAG: hypothetical protein JSV99_01630, partial [Planctomycetota bacterium]